MWVSHMYLARISKTRISTLMYARCIIFTPGMRRYICLQSLKALDAKESDNYHHHFWIFSQSFDVNAQSFPKICGFGAIQGSWEQRAQNYSYMRHPLYLARTRQRHAILLLPAECQVPTYPVNRHTLSPLSSPRKRPGGFSGAREHWCSLFPSVPSRS